MIYGIGIDIIDISRISLVVSRRGDRLAKRILTSSELSIYRDKTHSVRFLSKCYAVKEAASKAFGVGMRNGLSFSHFELAHDDLGKPTLRLFSYAAYLADKLSILGVYVTLSDEKQFVCALVIFEK